MKRLENRSAFVTGGGSGIGRATSLALADEGATVIVADLDGDAAAETSRLVVGRGGTARPLICDVANEQSVHAAFAEATRTTTLDILINNAGIAPGGDAVELATEDWDRTIAVNVRGMWLCSRAFIGQALRAGREAVVVNTSSTNAFFAEASDAAYTTSKGAVSALTRSMALDFASRGIRINCVCPGIILTPMTQRVLSTSSQPDLLRSHWDGLHAVGRIGAAEDIAPVIVFLATDDARFIIGAEIVVDGGYSIGTHTLIDDHGAGA